VTQTGLECRGTAYVGLDAGGFLPANCVSAEPPRSPDLAAAAALYLGCPYLWAGRSFLGLDCSGLVQEAFRDFGLAVPRDTDMQREAVGERIELAHISDLQRNDLIFMPGHVMIYAGDGTVIHASGGDMTVRQDGLAELMRGWNCGLGDFTVRRPG
jgi:cell wall-associated NlpC family hydrolase